MPHRFSTAALLLALASASVLAQQPPPPAPPPSCMESEYRQFDFWIGDWDTFEMEEPNGPSIARAEITPIVSGCALHRDA